MKKIYVILIAALVLVAVGTGVAIGMSNTVLNSDTVVLKSGKTKDIVLEENPSTGYMWSVKASEEGIIEIVKDRYLEGQSAPGAPGQHMWRIKAIEKGETTLTFNYERSWEENSSIETKTFTIVVK